MSKYISLVDASKLVGKSISTIKRFVRANKDKDIFRYENLPTGHKKIHVLKSEILKHFNSSDEPLMNSSSEPLLNSSDEPLNEPLKNETKRKDLSNDIQEEYIQHLKDTIKFLQDENKDLHEEFKNFQAIEQQAIERIKEQNHIIMQLQTVAEERQQKLNLYLNNPPQQQETYTVDAEDIEEVQEDTIVNERQNETPTNAQEQEPTTFSDWLSRLK